MNTRRQFLSALLALPLVRHAKRFFPSEFVKRDLMYRAVDYQGEWGWHRESLGGHGNSANGSFSTVGGNDSCVGGGSSNHASEMQYVCGWNKDNT